MGPRGLTMSASKSRWNDSRHTLAVSPEYSLKEDGLRILTASRYGRGGCMIFDSLTRERLVHDRLHVTGQYFDIGFLKHA